MPWRLPPRRCARELNIRLTLPVEVNGAGPFRFVVDSVTTPALAEAALGADGVLGIDALAGRRIRLDCDARAITVEDAHRRDSSQGADTQDIVVTARRQRGRLILAAAGSSGVRLSAVIDTGVEVTVGNAQLRARVLVGRKAPREPSAGVSASISAAARCVSRHDDMTLVMPLDHIHDLAVCSRSHR